MPRKKIKLSSIEAFHQAVAACRKEAQQRSVEPEIHVCTGGGCIASGSLETVRALEEALQAAGKTARIVQTGCMGPCSKGPVVRMMPDGITYEAITKDRAARIVQEHLIGGNIIAEFAQKDLETKEPTDDESRTSFFHPQQLIVLRNSGRIDPLRIEEYLNIGGYQALVKVLTDMTAEDVIKEMERSGLRGRGGAGFPTWMKWKFTYDAPGRTKYVLCNADEGDPGAFMDRSVLEGDPHSIIEGMAIAAYTVGASQGYVYVRAEYPLAIARLQKAIEQARSWGLLGKPVLGSRFSFDLEIRMGSGAFVCGEETALINSIEGKRGEPRPRPPFPAQKGLWDCPTLLNNVETYANVAAIIDKGSSWYSQFGTESSKGTKVFALAGSINNTGLVEVPIGTPLGDLIYDVGGGVKNGREYKATQIGGPSGGCIPKQHLNVPLDYDPLIQLGSIMGSGGMIVMDDTSCMVDVARYFLEFVQEESCGKCVPCRVGTKRMLEILTNICGGEGKEGDIETLEELGVMIKETSLCGLGQTAPNPVLSTIRHFREEYESHIRDRHCEAGVCAGLVRASCQSACPAHVDVPVFVALVAEGRYAEALKLHRERNPFAAVCARVCFHTCEEKCQRMSMDDSVAIRGIKRFMVDQEVTIQLPKVLKSDENAGKKIAIIGAGPAGLSCAYFLCRLGYRPTIFEAASRPGGMLVQTIPSYRLPRETLAREVRMIEQMGTDIITDRALGKDFTIESLREEGYEKVFIGLGAPESLDMGLPGEQADGVVQAVPFLQRYNIRGSVEVGRQVIVIGGGNAAIDAARTAMRLGADSVKIVYRRSREEMPAYAEEVHEAAQEGVNISPLTQPVEIVTDSDNKVAGLKCISMELGDFDASGRRRPTAQHHDSFTLEADQIIIAIGQRLDPAVFADEGIELNSRGFIVADLASGKTSVKDIFAGGDCVEGPSSVVRAIAAGERGAVGIDIQYTGKDNAFWKYEVETKTDFDPDADPVTDQRVPMREIPLERRVNNFEEVELPWDEHTAKAQARRCLRCDYGKHIKPAIKEDVNV